MPFLKIGIARGITLDEMIPAFQAAVTGGFLHLEITMNTPDAPSLISTAKKYFKGQALIGAGTVRNMRELDAALEAGAAFIVSPVTNIEMITFCRTNAVPVYPGALTPTEILTAWDAGATMVKVFPIGSVGGPDYVKEIKGPFDEIKILACGGVTPENVNQFYKNGAGGIAIGNRLFNREWIKAKQFELITAMAKLF